MPNRRQLREWLTAYALLLPSFAGLALFVLWPLIDSGYLSLTDWDFFDEPKFIGLKNYQKMLDDDVLHHVIANTAIYTLAVVLITLVLALGLAVLLNRPMRLRTLARTVFFLPVVTTLVAISGLWLFIYTPDFGLMTYLLRLAGQSGQAWMNQPSTALWAIILMMIWQGLGYDIIILLGGLGNIREDLYEAAALDGASRWTLFRHITLPLLSPTLVFLIIVSTIQAFRVFDPVYVMSGGLGGPANSTATLVFYLYKQAFANLDGGYASAIAYLIVGIALALTIIQLNISKRWVTYQ
ncbi:MAG: sugar ABC transporter permease [Chloroflexi bacterium]|nr:sugar ABC transporter permease [Chloroflexota bacterium]